MMASLSSPSNGNGRRTLVLFGDSITQMSFGTEGFGAMLADVYARRLDVLNRGFSGYNTRWARYYFDTIFGEKSEHAPAPEDRHKLVIVFFGANDASLESLNKRQHVPIKEYHQNLKWMCQCLLERASQRVLLVTPPPVDHAQRLEFQKERYGDAATGELERTNESAGLYADACRNVAHELGLPCCDLWQEMQSECEDWSKFLSDGLHFSRMGNRLAGEKLIETISNSFPELAVKPCQFTGSFANSGSSCDGLPELLPWHDKLDASSFTPY